MPEVKLTAVLNLSGKRSSAWVKEFAEEFELRVSDTRTSFSHEIDAAIILSVDWENHYKIAADFSRVNKIVLTDKPVCGSMGDVFLFRFLITQRPTLLFGGSALPYALEVLDALAQDCTGETTDIIIRGPLDPFFIGIHSAELLAHFFPLQPSTLVQATSERITVSEPGFLVHLLPSEAWSIELRQAGELHKFEIPTDAIYQNYLKKFVEFAEGRGASNILVSLNAVVVELAAMRSRKLKRAIKLSEITLAMSIESAEFVRSYHPAD